MCAARNRGIKSSTRHLNPREDRPQRVAGSTTVRPVATGCSTRTRLNLAAPCVKGAEANISCPLSVRAVGSANGTGWFGCCFRTECLIRSLGGLNAHVAAQARVATRAAAGTCAKRPRAAANDSFGHWAPAETRAAANDSFGHLHPRTRTLQPEHALQPAQPLERARSDPGPQRMSHSVTGRRPSPRAPRTLEPRAPGEHRPSGTK